MMTSLLYLDELCIMFLAARRKSIIAMERDKKGHCVVTSYHNKSQLCGDPQNLVKLEVAARHGLDLSLHSEHPACSTIIWRTKSVRARSSSLVLEQSGPDGACRPSEKRRPAQRIENLSIQPDYETLPTQATGSIPGL
jgi:hypothetical protein